MEGFLSLNPYFWLILEKKKKFKHAQDSIKMHMDWLYDKESIKMIKDKQQQNAILSVAFK